MCWPQWGLEFEIFHVPGPCLFLKGRFKSRKKNCSSFLARTAQPSLECLWSKPHAGLRNRSASSLPRDLGCGEGRRAEPSVCITLLKKKRCCI